MELSFLEWLRTQVPPGPGIALGIGDDGALLDQQTGKQTVVTTDLLMEGVDFVLHECGPFAAGRKALAVNLSDLAAMGAKPVAAFVSLCLPRTENRAQDLHLAQQLIQGMLPLAKEFDCPIAGGDTNAWSGPLVLNVTAIGEVVAGKAWRRDGARPGDAILVTGAFGGSLAGRHLTFNPRLHEVRQLHGVNVDVHAAIDVSDGLSLDLSRICQASGCGALVDLAKVPVHPDVDAARPESWRCEAALSDGEDFELILAVSPADAERLLLDQPLSARLTQIGTFRAESGLQQRLPDGRILPLQPRGYEH
jgi:thiamine-monophosphate kinase